MSQSRGKKFEERFKLNWYETVPDSICYRLMDAMSGYTQVSNVGDFICYKRPELFLIDCKSHEGNTIPFSAISQLDKMLEYTGITGVHPGIVWWSIDNDKVIWIPAETLGKLRDEGKKSFNIKYLCDDSYECLELPSKKLRTFMDTNYISLVEYYLGGVEND